MSSNVSTLPHPPQWPHRRTLRTGGLSWAGRWALNLFQHLRRGHLVLHGPNGETQHFVGKESGASAELWVRDWSALGRVVRHSDIGLAEAYRDGLLEANDWVACLRLAQQNATVLEPLFRGQAWRMWWQRLQHLVLNRNHRQGSRRNIAAHYDLGNDFYQLWLDPSMTYSSAWFGGDTKQDLAQAQAAKYQKILNDLALPASAQLLEIGCGWGGMLETGARAGHQLVGLTLSQEQARYAEQRLAQASLHEHAQVQLQDYRDHRGLYDGIISIEMFEAVGEAYWATYFAQIKRLLKPGARAVIQTITIDDAHFEHYRRSTDFIQQYIFPGGMLPSPSRFKAQAEHAGLREIRSDCFGLDYAETLQRWRQNFEQQLPLIRSQGFDEAFVRLWRFYLCYCEAGFLEGKINVQQTVLQA